LEECLTNKLIISTLLVIIASILIFNVNKTCAQAPIIHLKPNTVYIDNAQDLECLSRNIHYEAGGESFLGKLAVGVVTLNRQKLNNRSICEIVYEPYQFSWTLNPNNNTSLFSEDVYLAVKLLNTNIITLNNLDGALYFHNNNVKPFWSKSKRKVITIGNHTFYAE
jgi:spore germination cell wall hydrolase CwlJ-like protein